VDIAISREVTSLDMVIQRVSPWQSLGPFPSVLDAACKVVVTCKAVAAYREATTAAS
jgi:hypothetical protein